MRAAAEVDEWEDEEARRNATHVAGMPGRYNAEVRNRVAHGIV